MFYSDVKKLKENKPKIQNHFCAIDLLHEPPPFHIYNLAKVEACSDYYY